MPPIGGERLPAPPQEGDCDHDCGLCLFLATATIPPSPPMGVVGVLFERSERVVVADATPHAPIDLRIESTRGPPRSARTS